MWKSNTSLFVLMLCAALLLGVSVPPGLSSAARRQRTTLGPVSTRADNVMQFKADVFVSFNNAWWVRISITTQNNNIYVII